MGYDHISEIIKSSHNILNKEHVEQMGKPVFQNCETKSKGVRFKYSPHTYIPNTNTTMTEVSKSETTYPKSYKSALLNKVP